MEALNDAVATWWPVVVFIGGGAVWALRLEGRVNVLEKTITAVVEGEHEWRRMHAAEIAPQVQRIEETMDRIDSSVGSLTSSLGDVRERMAGMERAMNGHMKPWDGRTERRRT